MTMKTRLAVLKRLEAMYGLVEELHSIALRRATATVHEAEVAITWQMTKLKEARRAGRDAIGEGDWVGWAVAEIQREVSGQNRDHLETVRVVLESDAILARELYQKSHLQREQMKSVVEDGVKAEQVEEGRQTQASSDDHFLSRLHWNRLRFEAV
jgi:hypothetical protein